MSDRAPAQCFIYAVSPGDGEVNDPAANVLLALSEAGLRLEFEHDDRPEDTLQLGEVYGDSEAALNICDTLGKELIDLGATFVLWSDPKYEYGGVIVMHAPGVGTFSGSCDAEGQVYVTEGEIDKMLVASPPTVVALLREAYGTEVRQAIRQAQQELYGAGVQADA